MYPLLLYLLSQAVEHCDVCIHVVGVVSVRWVVFHCPLLRLGTLGGKHVTTVFGLIIHAVKASDLSGKWAVPWVQSKGRGCPQRSSSDSSKGEADIQIVGRVGDGQQGQLAHERSKGPKGRTYVFEKDTEVWVSLGVDGGLKHWKEDILQHLSKVWQEILGSEHITKGEREGNLGGGKA